MKMKRLHAVSALAILIILIILGSAYLSLFRKEKEDNPCLGLIYYKYKWGIAREITADSNRDGIIDVKYIMDGNFGQFASDDPPLEAWESHQCDGTMDVHYIFAPPGHLSVVEYDRDKNGDFEIIMRGAQIDEFLRTIQREGCASQYR